MATVTPQRFQGRWVVDLRAFGFGQRYRLSVPPDAPEVAAVHAAYGLLEKLRRGSAAESSPPAQEILPGTAPGGGLGGDCMFRFACDEWIGRQQWRTEGGAKWGRGTLTTVRRELGHLRIAQFEAPTGDDLLLGYVRGLREKGLAPASRRGRLSIAARVLKFCRRRGWLATMPEIPRAMEGGEPARAPIAFTPYTEVMFRKLRAEVLSKFRPGSIPDCPPGQEDAYRARRRLYLSFAFYTGVHTADLDSLKAESILLDFGMYMRVNSKSSRFVSPEPFDMPEGLRLDIEEELRRLGREWNPGELICGGRWMFALRTVKRAAKRLGLPPFDFRTVARRSCVWHYALLGWPEEHSSRILGHVDRRMIATVYRQYIPQRLRSPVAVPWTIENATRHPWRMDRPKAADVIPFQRPRAAEGGDDE